MQSPSQRSYVIFGIVALALLMSSLDGNIVAVALPAMLDQLHTSLAWIGWTLTGYQLTQTVILPLAGKLSDEWGRKRLFLGAVILFTLSSIACGLATNVYVLIFFRVLQAIGGGAFMPSATGIVSDSFGDRRMAAIGLFTSIFPLGGILGPNIGGFIVDHFSWRWIFYINGPIGLSLLLLGLPLLPSSAPRTSNRRVDIPGVAMFAGAMVAVLYAMTNWANNPESVADPASWLLVVGGVALLGVFLWHESRTASPMIEIELLRARAFAPANAYNFLYGAATFGIFSFIPYYTKFAFDMTAGESGLVMTPRSLAQVAFSTISSLFLIRFGYRWPMVAGGVLMTTSLLVLSQGAHDLVVLGWAMPNLLLVALEVGISGIGTGISGPASNNAALDLIPDKVSAMAGLRGMFRNTGGVISTALIILTLSHYQDKVVGMQQIFRYWGLLSVFLVPLAFLIPDMARARRQAPPVATPHQAGVAVE